MSARLRTGDSVVILSGKDKGKTGKVARVLVDDDKVIVEGINLVKRHTRPTPKNPQGGIIEKEAALHACKVALADPKTGKATRVKSGKDDKGNKVRIAVKSGEVIPFVKTASKSGASE